MFSGCEEFKTHNSLRTYSLQKGSLAEVKYHGENQTETSSNSITIFVYPEAGIDLLVSFTPMNPWWSNSTSIADDDVAVPYSFSKYMPVTTRHRAHIL